MKILKRVKNNLEYAKWRKIRKEALEEMTKHQHDADDTEFKYWAHLELLAMKKCIEIDIN